VLQHCSRSFDGDAHLLHVGHRFVEVCASTDLPLYVLQNSVKGHKSKQLPEAANDRLLMLASEAVERIGWSTVSVEAYELEDGSATFRIGSDTELCFISPRSALTLPDDVIVDAAVSALRHGGDLAMVFLGGLSEERSLKSQGLDT